MLRRITGHTILVNWDDRGPEIARQVLDKHRNSGRPSVVVLAATEVALPNDLSENLILLVGNANDVDTLSRARVSHARSVVILSNWKTADPQERRRLDPDSADSRTMMTIMAIRSLCAGGSQIPVIAEIKKKTNIPAAQHCSGAGNHTELVCVDNFGTDLLACLAVTPGLARVVGELLRAEGGTGIRNMHVPTALVGHSFSDLLRWSADSHDSSCKETEVPIGISRDRAIFISPNNATIGTLKETDQLVVIYCDRVRGGVSDAA